MLFFHSSGSGNIERMEKVFGIWWLMGNTERAEVYFGAMLSSALSGCEKAQLKDLLQLGCGRCSITGADRLSQMAYYKGDKR